MKKRIDILVFERGHAKSREKARVLIIAGLVYANKRQVKLPSEQFEEDVEIVIKGDFCPYVSRGGLKLEKALKEFQIVLAGRVCADIGASTGGFTDCMLKNGASHVYAVDVGYGQFDFGLRNDPRVVVMERTNARYLEALEKPVDFISVDVSFISLALIFPAILRIGHPQTEVVALIKPQFEAGREKVGKKGVVKSPETHFKVIDSVLGCAIQNGLYPNALTYSPVKGPNGNIEFLAHFVAEDENKIKEFDIEKVVTGAHRKLNL